MAGKVPSHRPAPGKPSPERSASAAAAPPPAGKFPRLSVNAARPPGRKSAEPRRLPPIRAAMASRAAASLLFVLALSGRGGAAETEEVAVGELDGEVTLRCWNASSQVLVVQWFHGEPGAIPMLFSSDGKLPSDSRLSLVENSSLHISGLRREDEGHYLCREILAETNHTHRIQLLMAGGPELMEVKISPTGTLPNGTLYAKRHDILNFTCSSDSWPDSATKWDFNPLGSAQEPFTEVNSSQSSFVLHNVMPNYQGNYSCLATNLLSQRQKSVVRELLIYYLPPSSPRCQAETSVENSQEVQLSCSWPGGYPPPTLQWINLEGLAMDSNTTHFANATVVSLQGSRRLWGKDFVCRGNHIANEKKNQNCTLRLERPSVMANPMKRCFAGRSIEMTCELTAGNPPARITWWRNSSKVETEIRSRGRVLISQKEGVSSLVIQNCSASRDQGYYICKAENPLGPREVYVHLKVTDPLNVAGIVGSVVVLLLLGVLVFSGILLYAGPQVCLKGIEMQVTSLNLWTQMKMTCTWRPLVNQHHIRWKG
ncbi:V-set and immunoglobulin domain-containing protein 10 isoform X2 [Crotalus tigris]|uniref:V-set and immunoglobulin domain-containing protein 10 isoform X2 n=1 Tax=Crotalus tigris TaxID=88082 RepID=UPI00192F7CEF|nr:V-set and immunoglobulin domain-containing protein 10 isoform X2 [Crotalus tigris]